MAVGNDLSTGKIVEIVFEKFVETYEQQMQLLDLVDFEEPDGSNLQDASNVVWERVQQHAKVEEGWDMSTKKTGVIEETVPLVLGEPLNDPVQLRADDMRNESYWSRRAEESGKRQATELNKRIADAIILQGSLSYRIEPDSGFDFISEAQTMMDERQLHDFKRYFILNNRESKRFASDLAARQTLQGRPEQVWKTGQIAQNVAGFDIFTASYLAAFNNVGGTVSITADQSFKPEGGTVNPITKEVSNVDYRTATMGPFTGAGVAGILPGTKVYFGVTGPKAIGLADKTPTGQPMYFTVIENQNPNLVVYPKPIAADDLAPAYGGAVGGSLTPLQIAYANVDTTIKNGDILNFVLTTSTYPTNIFFDRTAVKVIGGTIPATFFAQFGGKKVVSRKLSNGLTLYLLYDSNIDTMMLDMRLFTWYGITVVNPSNCGAAYWG